MDDRTAPVSTPAPLVGAGWSPLDAGASGAPAIDLTGRAALVTGGSGELGRTMARTLARCGASVIVHYHRGRERAEAVAAEVNEAGGRAVALPADVGEEASVLALRDHAREWLGGGAASPDIVVANAVAQYDPWTRVLEQPLADFDSQYRTCVLQSVLLARAFVPQMQEKGWGRFLAISTECAMQCGPDMGAYAAGKRGMDGVLRVLAREAGPFGVTVNQVAPGWMISDKFRAAGTERQEGYEANVPLRRRGDDQDVANAVAFLASDLADFITGVYLPVCGGNVMPAI